MKKMFLVAAAMLAAACGPLESTEEGGANAHDRSDGSDDGELLSDGAMAIAPSGSYVIAQRRATSVIVDVKGLRYRELDFKGERFVFAKNRDVAYTFLPQRAGIAALDLATGQKLWEATPALKTNLNLATVTADDAKLVVADHDRVLVMNAQTGEIEDAVKVGLGPADIEILPGNTHAMVVGSTTWSAAGPNTPVSLVDLAKKTGTTIDVPNCAAPLSVLPDGKRALLSPTFCAIDQASAPTSNWKNPDPVSVIDIDAAGGKLTFIKNLPGFGPTALLTDGRAVAYLDMKRLDPAMFDDKSQIPPADAAQYHLMLIEPQSMKFELIAIGDKLPRFAPSKNGRALLVDATVHVVRSEVSATISLDESGLKAEVKGAFGDTSGSLFGVFDLGAKQYVPFAGPPAALDRFVQVGDGSFVFTLKNNGLGGDLFSIDVGARATVDLERDVRDIGILPDGRTLVLRIRLKATANRHLREEFCFTTDPRACTLRVEYISPTPQSD
jgi:hypothetical protein